MCSKSDQIAQLKNERAIELYHTHQNVIDSLAEDLADNTDALFAAADECLERFDTLVNSYSILGGIMKDDKLLYCVSELQELKELSLTLRNRQKLRSMELLRYTEKALRLWKEVLEE